MVKQQNKSTIVHVIILAFIIRLFMFDIMSANVRKKKRFAIAFLLQIVLSMFQFYGRNMEKQLNRPLGNSHLPVNAIKHCCRIKCAEPLHKMCRTFAQSVQSRCSKCAGLLHSHHLWFHRRYFRSTKQKKMLFFFCPVLAYSYLCSVL